MVKPNRIIIRNEEEEYAQVRKDLIFVLIFNSLFFILLFALYFWNRVSGVVDGFFGKLLKF